MLIVLTALGGAAVCFSVMYVCVYALTESVRKLGGELPELTLRSGPPVGEDQLGIIRNFNMVAGAGCEAL
jgi:hypothetical protein